MRKLFKIIFLFFILSLFSFKYPFILPILLIPIFIIKRKDFIIFYLIFIFSGIFRVYFFEPQSFIKTNLNSLKGTVVSFEKEKSFILKTDSGKFLIYKNGDFDLYPNDYIKVDGYTLDSYKGNPHEESYYIFNLTEGIKGFFYADKITIIKKDNSLISNIRIKLYKNFNKFGKTGELLKGFVLGGETVDSEIKDIFKLSGLIHIFAISGIHISILSQFFSLILNPLIVIFILFIYLFLILFPISASRTFFMYSFYLFGKTFKKEIDNLNTLLLSAIILILINPLNIISPSFLLTFVSTLSLITISEKMKSNLLKIFISPVFITFGSFPILIYFFPYFSLTTIISNTIFIPILSILLPIFFFFSLISIFLENILILLKPILNLLEKFVLFLSSFPISSIGIKKPNLIFIISFFMLYFLLILIFINEINYKKSKKLITIISFLIIISFLYPYFYEFNRFKIIFFDVGEGDSILIKTPQNKTILIDGGGSSNKNKRSPGLRVLYSLKRMGINKIDYLIFTHDDIDHIEGLFHIVKREKVKTLFYPYAPINKDGIDLIKYLENENTQIKKLKRGDNFNIGNVKFYVLNPYQGGKDYLRANDNNNSICILLRFENRKILLTGDIENEAIEEIYNIYPDLINNVDIFKVPHHGSKNSFNINFYDTLDPKISIISVGPNTFNHPSNEIINYLLSLNSKIFRTDLDGAIEIEIYKNRMNIKNYNFSEIIINLFD